MDLNEAIRAHSEWKMKLRSAISERATLDPVSLAQSDHCALGKWLHGESRAKYGHLGSHKNCVQLHTEFHKQASKIAATINSGRYSEAEQMLGSGTPYTDTSHKIVMAIGTLKREAGL